MKRHGCSRCGAVVALEKASGGAAGYCCPSCGFVGIVEAAKRPSKYGSIRTEVNGEWFDSKAEAERYKTLLLMEKGGAIRNLKRQVPFPLVVNGHLIATYRCDFAYIEPEGEDEGVTIWRRVIEDVKGKPNDRWPLVKKLMAACYSIDIRETHRGK